MGRRFPALVALSVLFGALAAIPTPYWILAPGNAVDLRTHVQVEGYPPPLTRYFLTDVNVQRATVLALLARFLPGVKLVREETLIPKGIAPKAYDEVLVQAMSDSQDVAAVVAERAAGFRVADPPTHAAIAAILPQSQAGRILRVGDILTEIAGHRVRGSGDVAIAIAKLRSGTVPVVFLRAGRTERVRVHTIRMPAGTRLGIMVETRAEKVALPVPVRFTLENISGSSGGLMIALQIYGTLHALDLHPGALIAGTGTLGYDGTVGPIEGTQQKLIAAKRAGALMFLVPKQNFADISSEHGLRVIPVGSFKDALNALRG